MQSQNPITVDGKTFDKLSVNLAVSTTYTPSGEREMSIALRVIPTRVDAEGVATADAQAYTVYRGRLSELRSQDEAACVQSMTAALQQFIASQGW